MGICCFEDLSFPTRIVQCFKGGQYRLSRKKQLKTLFLNTQKCFVSKTQKTILASIKNYVLGHKVCEGCSKKIVNGVQLVCPMRCGTAWMGRDYGLEDYLERSNQVFLLFLSHIRHFIAQDIAWEKLFGKNKTILDLRKVVWKKQDNIISVIPCKLNVIDSTCSVS